MEAVVVLIIPGMILILAITKVYYYRQLTHDNVDDLGPNLLSTY